MASVSFRNIREGLRQGQGHPRHRLRHPDGEFVVLVGPSGCGKSTLLRMLAGLEDITGGEILIDGKVVNDLESKDRDIAMVFQSYALYPHMTVRENMAFSLQAAQGRPAADRERVDNAARILNLDALLDRYPRELSGRPAPARGHGPRHRARPQGLPVRRAAVQPGRQAARGHARRDQGPAPALKTTTVYVTHDQIEAMTMADRIVVMHDGIIEQIGTPLELFDRPGNLFVAQFIGSPGDERLQGLR
jgi:multiple sugar transport system ATP-binding protein